MGNKDRSAMSQQWPKRFAFATLWGVCFLILLIVARNIGLPSPCKDLAKYGLDFKPAKNEIQGLSYTYKENSRPVYSVQVSNLRTENNNFGIFKTGLHKVVKIQDLQLAFHRYTCGRMASAQTDSCSKSSNVASTGSGDIYSANLTEIYPASGKGTANVRTIVETARRLLQPKKGWRFDIDFSNTSEILVSNFEYKVFCDQNPSFSLQSKRLMVSSDQPGVTLRGHVTIKAADGSTLESNYVQWDVVNQYFTAKGGYVLNRNGTNKIGKNISVNAQLNEINAQQAKFEQKEKTECLASLQSPHCL